MKRSEINHYIDEALEFWEGCGFRLPPYARWNAEEWRSHASECMEIFDVQIGWDLTDFGSGDFLDTGLLLYTLRNGILGSKEYSRPYAEKIMMVRENQVTPCHFHWKKLEDIINRGGGNLVIELYHADPERNVLCDTPFTANVNGMLRRLNPGDKVILAPGESMTMEHFHAHKFYGEKGSGPVMVGEVSMVNDDEHDNCFLEKVARFSPVTEDETPRYLLGCEYRNFLRLHA